MGIHRILILLLIASATQDIGSECAWAEAELPNIVIIYADDLGFGDLSCYNADSAYQTPAIDRLAAQGIRFTDAHSPSTICSPSRYGLLSGELVCRTGRRSTAFEGPGGPSYLAPDQLTLPGMLRAHGYRTGVFGKWHLGLTWYDEQGNRLGGGFDNTLKIDYAKSTPLEDGPNRRGFDESFVTPNCPTTDPLYVYIENGLVPIPADHRHRRSRLPNLGGKWLWDNDEGWVAPGYRFIDADELFLERCLGFIRQHSQSGSTKPFFAILSTQISHAPVLPGLRYRGRSDAGPRSDFIVQLDSIVERLMQALEELDVADNTLVVFNSDNGPETVHVDWMRKDHQHDPAGGFRGMKRDGWEGGHRVPLIIRWPGWITPGQTSEQLVNTTDLLATMASVIGHELDPADAVDSVDLLPVLLGRHESSTHVRPFMLTQSFRGEFQLRVGAWKYLAHKGSGGNNYDRGFLQEYRIADTEPEAPGQLYRLDEDPMEKTNLFHVEKTRRLQMQQLLSELTDARTGRTSPVMRKPLGPLPRNDVR